MIENKNEVGVAESKCSPMAVKHLVDFSPTLACEIFGMNGNSKNK